MPTRFLISILLLTCFCFLQIAETNAQYKPSSFEINTLPQWAQEMYGENPNYFQIERLYKDYYRSHTFKKSFHTQYYKRWKRDVINFVDENGFIYKPNREEQAEVDSHFIQKHTNQTNRSSNWSLVGPLRVTREAGVQGKTQSNIYSLTQSLSNSSILYCGTEPGEIYKSEDEGETWTNVSMNYNYGGGVTAITTHPNNPNIVFAGGSNGVFRSIDGGETWLNVLPETNFGVNELFINPDNAQLIFAATDKGFYRSSNGGSDWTQIYTQRCYDVKSNTANSAEMYLVKNNPQLIKAEFFKSVDFGATWIIQSTGWYDSTDPARSDGGARIAVTPANPNRIYAYLIGQSKPNDFGYIGVYRSDDNGSSWSLPNGPVGGPYTEEHPNLAYGYPDWTYHQGFYNCAIMASETNADQILVGGLNLWRSDDGGSSFSSVAGYVGGPLDLHVDMQDFRASNGTYWITTDGGIYKTSSFYTEQPDFKMNGIHGSEYWGFGSGWNEDVLVGGLYHNGNLAYHENYGYGNFLSLGGGEAPTGYVNPGNSRRTYFSDIGGKIIPQALTEPIISFFYSKHPNEAYWAAESSEMEFHPNCYNSAYLGSDNEIWQTNDGGTSFTLLHTFGNNVNNQIKYIEIASDNPNIIYLNQQPASGNTGTLWKTTDGGISWNTISIPAGNSRRMLLTLNPSNANELWIGYPGGSNGNKIFKTENGGQTWINLSTPALNNESVQALTYVAGTNGGVYYCTQRSVYYRNAQMTDWIMDNNGLPMFFSSNIARPFYRDSKIRIASYGKGIWESPLHEAPAQPIARITVDKLSQTVVCNADSFYFVDYSFVNHQGTSRLWSFEGGEPSNSTLINPTVVFTSPGLHWATLTITDSNGVSSVDSIQVEVINFVAPSTVSEGFQTSFPPNGWLFYNEDGNGQWTLQTNVGAYGLSSSSIIFNNYDIDSQGSVDDFRFLISNTGTFSGYLTFDVAYAPWGGSYSDTLEVLISNDCGATFERVYRKGGAELSTRSALSSLFVPTSSEWRTDTINLNGFESENELMIAFRNIGNWGNALYIDNINLLQVVGEKNSIMKDLSIFPNPAKAGTQLTISLPDDLLNQSFKYRVLDLNGKILSEGSQTSNQLDLPGYLASGTYVVHIKTKTNIWNKLIQVID